MKMLTIATHSEGYFEVLTQTARDWGYDLKILGWQQPWQGFAWKIQLYIDELKSLPPEEPVVCVDGYDVVVVGSSEEMLGKFNSMNAPIVFSGQRYFPTNKLMRSLSDQLMSNDTARVIGETDDEYDYSRPCMGLFVGYAGNLQILFEELWELEKIHQVANDQVLLNIYYLKHPSAITLDYTCQMFQNLWRTQGMLYGRISPKSKNSEIVVISTPEGYRVQHKAFETLPCFIHGPFNLDLSQLLRELHLQPKKLGLQKGWRYWNYSMMHHFKRSQTFFNKKSILSAVSVLFQSKHQK